MSDRALISDLTWRSLEMQKAAFPDIPHFTLDEISSLLRPTSRKETDIIRVISLAVIADNEKDFREVVKLMKARCVVLHALEEEKIFKFMKSVNIEPLVADWKFSRKNGAAKVGGRISADNRKKKSAAGVALIKDRWGMPSKTWPTHVLLKEADISYNTAKTLLPPRPIAQYNYQAKMKRKANAKR